jgi:hypothetical protein
LVYSTIYPNDQIAQKNKSFSNNSPQRQQTKGTNKKQNKLD